MSKIPVGSLPQVVELRKHAARFFIWLIWAHVPVVVALGLMYRTNALAAGSVAFFLAAAVHVIATRYPEGLWTRAAIAIALTGMPILFVYCAQGPWQIDYHMYFFAVFAMLVAFCDWRPIVISAVLTAMHHAILDAVAPAAVFPSEGGVGRVLLHGAVVLVECGVLIWITSQLRSLFRTAAEARALAEARLAEAERAAITLAHNVSLEAEIAEAKRIEGLLLHLAYHDDLTGLRSRSYFMDSLTSLIQRAQTTSAYGFAVLFIDLDRFKQVNDGLGHRVGDLLLMEIANRLKECVRPDDTVARLGGDEFTVLLDGISDVSEATAVADRITEALGVPFLLDAVEVPCTASIGIALSSGNEQRADELLRNADRAMYEAKFLYAGRGGYVVSKETKHVDAALPYPVPRSVLN